MVFDRIVLRSMIHLCAFSVVIFFKIEVPKYILSSRLVFYCCKDEPISRERDFQLVQEEYNPVIIYDHHLGFRNRCQQINPQLNFQIEDGREAP